MLVLITVSISAQSLSSKDKKDIETRMDEYFVYTQENDYVNMMEYVYPKIFTLASKEQLVEVFSGMEAMGIRLNVKDIEINEIQALMTKDDKQYAVANYDIDIRLDLLNELMQSDEAVESLKSSFKVSYDATDMSYDKEAGALSFHGKKWMLAIKDPEFDGDNWYFLEYDASNPMAAEMILDGDVLTMFKKKMN